MALPGGTSPAEVLGAVSCATADDCVAVGDSWAALGTVGQGPTVTPTIQRFASGAWSAEDAGDRRLEHISCPTASSCMAVGSDLGVFWSRHWDGTAWRDLPAITDQRAGGVTGLSCATASWCLVTTTRFTSGGDVAWVWTGGDTWTEGAALGDFTGVATGVSCPAPGDCVAISNWIDPEVFRLVNGAWTPVDTAGLALDQYASVDDVDCVAPGECAVVGDNGFVDGRTQGLLAVLSGGSWSLTSPPGTSAIDVDCWSTDGCVAAMSGDLPHLQAWDGTRWSVVENPPGIARPSAVSCGAPRRCEVTGSFVDGADRSPVAGMVLDDG
jgi:hypothetical protein